MLFLGSEKFGQDMDTSEPQDNQFVSKPAKTQPEPGSFASPGSLAPVPASFASPSPANFANTGSYATQPSSFSSPDSFTPEPARQEVADLPPPPASLPPPVDFNMPKFDHFQDHSGLSALAASGGKRRPQEVRLGNNAYNNGYNNQNNGFSNNQNNGYSNNNQNNGYSNNNQNNGYNNDYNNDYNQRYQRPSGENNRRQEFYSNDPEPVVEVSSVDDNSGFMDGVQDSFPDLSDFGMNWDPQKVRTKRSTTVLSRSKRSPMKNPFYYSDPRSTTEGPPRRPIIDNQQRRRRRPVQNRRPQQQQNENRRQGPKGFWDDADFDNEFFNGGGPNTFSSYDAFGQENAVIFDTKDFLDSYRFS